MVILDNSWKVAHFFCLIIATPILNDHAFMPDQFPTYQTDFGALTFEVLKHYQG